MTLRNRRGGRNVPGTVRRFAALCLLFALAAGQATTLAAATASGRDAGMDHHHPGCPWEARDEPCPHAAPPGTPDAPAWAPCPPMDLEAPPAAGPDPAPPASPVEWAPPAFDPGPDAGSSEPASDVRPSLEPRPPRGPLSTV